VVVLGTCGTDEENRINLELARSFAQRWWYRANGYVRMIRDTDFDSSVKNQCNIVLIGGPTSNSLSARVAAAEPSMPIRISASGVWLGQEFIQGDDLACQFVYPNPFDREELILAEWGTSVDGMRLAGSLNCIYSGSGLPDFMVYDKTVRLTGLAGVRAAGFFDNGWSLNPEYYYLRSR
jgi:hypothetical protein